jgi:cytochrome c-type biogenesis protein CcmH
VAAADQMTDAQRQAMIAQMVDTLAARLKANPKDAEGWMRLMKARMVLGQTDQAVVAYRDARKAFAASAPEQAQSCADAAQGVVAFTFRSRNAIVRVHDFTASSGR